jgi:hypothetical protein
VGVGPTRRLLPLLAWFALLVGTLLGMRAAGHGALAGPPLHDPSSWGHWAATRPAPDAAMAVLRLVVVALTWYLLGTGALAVALRLGRAGRLVELADVLTLPAVRRAVQAGLGVGLAGLAVVPVGSGIALASPSAPATAEVHGLSPDDAAPVLQEVGGPVPTEARTWTVAGGEHLWSISGRVLSAAWGRAPTDDEIAPFWHRVVEGNRDRLADPGNPDLIFPGQVLLVPDPPPLR